MEGAAMDYGQERVDLGESLSRARLRRGGLLETANFRRRPAGAFAGFDAGAATERPVRNVEPPFRISRRATPFAAMPATPDLLGKGRQTLPAGARSVVARP